VTICAARRCTPDAGLPGHGRSRSDEHRDLGRDELGEYFLGPDRGLKAHKPAIVARHYGIGDHTRVQKGGSMRVKLPA
jgi:hypothetical protein